MNRQNENYQVFEARDAFFDKLYELAKKDKNIIFLTADMNAHSLVKFKKDLPDQFFNTGIAEQNTVLLASGLSLSDKKVFIYEITPFITTRCFEQIKIDIAYMNLDVVIIGVGTGFTYGIDGPTHYSVDDIAIMSTLKNIEIFGTNDKVLTESVCELSYKSKNPVYVRLEKGFYRDIHKDTNFLSGCSVIKNGEIPIFSTGRMIYEVLSIVNELEKNTDVTFSVVDVYRLQPINDVFIASIIDNAGVVIVIEEHLRDGGLGNMIENIIFKNSYLRDFLHLHIKADWNSFYGNSEFMLRNSGLDKDSLIKTITDYVG